MICKTLIETDPILNNYLKQTMNNNARSGITRVAYLCFSFDSTLYISLFLSCFLFGCGFQTETFRAPHNWPFGNALEEEFFWGKLLALETRDERREQSEFRKLNLCNYYSAHCKTVHCKYMSRKTIAFLAMSIGFQLNAVKFSRLIRTHLSRSVSLKNL